MKNGFKKAMCVFASLAILTSMWGCTVSKSNKHGEETTKDGQVVNYSELSTVDGTAAVTYKYTDAEGKEKTNKIDIDMEDVDSVEIVSSMDISSDKFLNGIAQKGYQMDDKKAKEVAENPDNYKEFRFIEYIQNTSERTMAYKSVRVPGNGKNGIWINTSLDAEFTMIPGGVTEVYVYGIADMSKYDEQSLQEEFRKMKIQLEYVLCDSAQDDIDWEAADVKTIDFH